MTFSATLYRSEEGDLMAERRMFSLRIVNSARFLRMPVSSRLLYYDLGMHADDDGVVEAFSVMTMTGATEDDLRVLCSKGFVSVLNEDLVTYINDWQENNRIRPDRKVDSIYKHLLVQMNVSTLPQKERADTGKPTGSHRDKKTTDGQPMDNQWTTVGPQLDRIGKDSIGKDSIYIEESNSLRSLSSSCSEPSKKSSKPADNSPVFIELETNKEGVLFSVTEQFVNEMKALYPAVDVEQELRNMKGWCLTNKSKRKTKEGMPRFINKWLSKEQNEGKGPQPNPSRYQKAIKAAPDYNPDQKLRVTTFSEEDFIDEPEQS